MLMIGGFIFVAIAIWMSFLLWRNARRPRQEVRIEMVFLDFVRNDYKKTGPLLLHALVKFNYEGKNYESKIFLKIPGKAEGDWVEISFHPEDPSMAELYAPDKEKRIILLLFVIGAFLIGGSWWIMDYFEAW